MLRITNQQNLLPLCYRTALSVPKVPVNSNTKFYDALGHHRILPYFSIRFYRFD